nr:hypothetical protein [Tanacetum cinerariifolium]
MCWDSVRLQDDSQGEAFLTVSGLEAGQDRENIIKTYALPHDSTPRVTSLDADEGTQDLEISSLKARIKLLEDKDKGTAELSGDYAPIKGRSLETGEEEGVERSTKRGSNDTEELVNVLTSLDAANILTSGVQAVSVPPAAEVSNVGVPTGSGLVPTISAIFTTASVVTPYSRRKGKEKMLESDTPKKKKIQEQIDVQMAREMEEEIARDAQRMNEQIARDAEIARIHAEEEPQMLIDGLDRNNEMIAKHLHEYEQAAADLTIGEKIELINELVKYQDHHAKILKSMTLEEIKEKIIPVWKQIEDFVPMSSKEEGERFKRKELRLEQGSDKKMKTSEEPPHHHQPTLIYLKHHQHHAPSPPHPSAITPPPTPPSSSRYHQHHLHTITIISTNTTPTTDLAVTPHLITTLLYVTDTATLTSPTSSPQPPPISKHQKGALGLMAAGCVWLFSSPPQGCVRVKETTQKSALGFIVAPRGALVWSQPPSRLRFGFDNNSKGYVWISRKTVRVRLG